MPRKGKGSKSQVIQTAKGQEYGQAGRQAEAQSVVPLPQNVGDVEGRGVQPAAQPLAGTLPNPFRPSDRPGEPVGTTLPPQVAPDLTPERASLLPQMLPILYTLTNNPYADPEMKSIVRRMENFIPTRFDQV